MVTMLASEMENGAPWLAVMEQHGLPIPEPEVKQ